MEEHMIQSNMNRDDIMLYYTTVSTFIRLGLGVMVFNATFNNISVISWPSVLLVEETGVPEENLRPAASH
jgi:hypothetical protein